ncbi:MAG: CBS domain-containing protein [Rhodothermales bacterium]
MQVHTIMTRQAVTVSPDAILMDVRGYFSSRGIHHLLVVDEGRLVGIISDRDMLQAVSPFLDTHTEDYRDVGTLMREAREIMSRDPVTIRPDGTVEEAATLLLEYEISCLPVVSESGEVEGILTSKDILKYSSQHYQPE